MGPTDQPRLYMKDQPVNWKGVAWPPGHDAWPMSVHICHKILGPPISGCFSIMEACPHSPQVYLYTTACRSSILADIIIPRMYRRLQV